MVFIKLLGIILGVLFCSNGRDKASQNRFHGKICLEIDCTDCPLKERCTKAKAKKILWSGGGAQIHARRKIGVENAFGHIKGNLSFRRCSLWGPAASPQLSKGAVPKGGNLAGGRPFFV